MHCLCCGSLCRAVPLRETAHNGVPVHCETVRRFACAVPCLPLPCRRCELLVITPPVRPGVSPLVACAGLAVSHQRGVLDLICLAPLRSAFALHCDALLYLCRAVPCQSLPLLCSASLYLCRARPRNASCRPAMPKPRGTMPLLRQGSHCHAHAVRCSAVQRLNIAHLALPLPLLGRASVRFACANQSCALHCQSNDPLRYAMLAPHSALPHLCRA